MDQAQGSMGSHSLGREVLVQEKNDACEGRHTCQERYVACEGRYLFREMMYLFQRDA